MPAPDFDIRPLVRAEAAAWRVLRLEMLKNHPISFKSSYEDVAQDDLSVFADRIPPAGGVDALFGVFVGGVLRGSAGFSRDQGTKIVHKGFMWSVYLHPSLRGQGVGEALIAHVMDYARQVDVTVLRCSVTSENRNACELYRRMGFSRYGVEPRALIIGGRELDEDLLQISLD